MDETKERRFVGEIKNQEGVEVPDRQETAPNCERVLVLWQRFRRACWQEACQRRNHGGPLGAWDDQRLARGSAGGLA